MKKLNLITLEKMRRELEVLEESKMASVKGGYVSNQWGCVFNAMESVGNSFGIDKSAEEYHSDFVEHFGYDPSKVTGHNPNRPSQENLYLGVHDNDLDDAFMNAGYGVQLIGAFNDTPIDGSQLMIMPQHPVEGNENPGYHAWVIDDYDCTGMIIYYRDPASGTTGSISVQDSSGCVFLDLDR